MPNLLGPIVGPLTSILEALTGAIHSYGLAIIIFTLGVKLVLAPLNIRQLQSARKMSALAPRLKAIQQKYKNDREELTKQQMALYKESGVNPAAGCLPLLVQLPILYAMFFVFRDLAGKSAAAIYHAHFLWYELDKPDHLFTPFLFGSHVLWGPLPLLAALLQWVQSRMMMQPTSDPQQRTTQQIMQLMPLFVILFAVNYPAGLAMYWITSSVFAIGLQYFTTGWGQLFNSPFHLPHAPVDQAGSRPDVVSRPSRLLAGESGTSTNGKAKEPGASVASSILPASRRSTPSTPAVSNGPSIDPETVRLGKMQRTVSRPKARPRSSRGAKR